MKRLHIPIDLSWADIKPNSLNVTVEPEEVEVTHAKKTGWMEAFTRPVGEQILGYTFRRVKAEVVFVSTHEAVLNRMYPFALARTSNSTKSSEMLY